jgi:cation diffusion facilitator family transporter
MGLALTGLFELALGLLGGSVGLLGDALHNLSDVSTSAVVFLGFRLSRRPATDTHPYGWERAEDIAGLGVALVVWASAVFAGLVSVHKLLEHGRTSHVYFGMAAAVVGVVGNQVVARYKGRVGRRIQSSTLVADAAQHSWLDAISSAGALLGLIGVAVGLPWADGVAGLLSTAFIAHVGYEVTGHVLSHLMDSVEPEVLAAAVSATEALPEVRHAHARARWMRRSLLIADKGFLDPDTPLAAGAALGPAVDAAIARAVPRPESFCGSPVRCRAPTVTLVGACGRSRTQIPGLPDLVAVACLGWWRRPRPAAPRPSRRRSRAACPSSTSEMRRARAGSRRSRRWPPIAQRRARTVGPQVDDEACRRHDGRCGRVAHGPRQVDLTRQFANQRSDRLNPLSELAAVFASAV